MNFLDSLRISSSALTAQRTRMNVISSNLANVNTTRTPTGGPYQRKDVIFAAVQDEPLFQKTLESNSTSKGTAVKVVGISIDPRPALTKYNPSHPDADEKGFVSMPNINLIEEMVNMLSASRSYEANVTAINITKKMAMKAMEIGR